MRIGIISLLSNDTVNYGNHLQAYALNTFLREHCSQRNVESILLGPKQLRKYTGVFSYQFYLKVLTAVIRRLRTVGSAAKSCSNFLAGRRKAFSRFRRESIPIMSKNLDRQTVKTLDYDVIVVGSDMVWSQVSFMIDRIKFLDFKTKKHVRRISYAASFGRDYIPEENIWYIRKYLRAFDAISVREHSSVKMLEDIGISNVSYCLDPTLLLSEYEWGNIEVNPPQITEGCKFIFVYLLGEDESQRKAIKDFAYRHYLKIVTVPYANGKVSEVDNDFGDIQLMDCSIENWIWLIHHAEYIFSDSFHGVVFSTIFQKKFIALKRVATIDMNNRIQDYLREIGQLDKVLATDKLEAVDQLTWDYDRINNEIDIRRRNSIAFLKKHLENKCRIR